MLGLSIRTHHIRDLFKSLLATKSFTTVNREASMTALTGNTTIEIVGACFLADEESIFGVVNKDYIAREEAWYNSMSLNVNDIPGGPPAIWKSVADKDGYINSNYGWTVFSYQNTYPMYDKHYLVTSAPQEDILCSSQYNFAFEELKKNPESRRAIMIYTRPSMWREYNLNGRSDFMCTNTVQYLIRDGKLHAIVNMRSNDAWAGFRNDRAWQLYVQQKLAAELGVDVGDLIWQVGSLHVYARHYFLVDHYTRTGEMSITKEQYKELYPDSPFC